MFIIQWVFSSLRTVFSKSDKKFPGQNFKVQPWTSKAQVRIKRDNIMDRATNSFGFFIQSLSSIDFQVAMMLIIIVVVFVVCHSIRSIVNSYEFIQYIMYGNLASWPDWIATLVHFRLVLLLRHIWFVMFQHYILFIYQQLISLIVGYCTRKTH